MITDNYKEKSALVLKVLKFVSQEEIFALKGGTAINFFVRDLPRLSEDIDLTYISFDDRETAIKNINNALSRIQSKLAKENIQVKFNIRKEDKMRVMIHKNSDVFIKIDVNYDARGYIYPPNKKPVISKIQKEYKDSFVEMQIVSFKDLMV